MAFDCTANPNHRFKGKAASLWACLAAAQSCPDVEDCIFPGGREPCGSPGDYTACGNATNDTGNNHDVRIECADGGFARGENCALWGQTCTSGSAGALCSGDDAGDCAARGSGCYGARSIYCGTDAAAVAIDCASFGTRRCSGFPTADSHAQWVACVAEVDAQATSACAPDASAACVGDVAVSCPSGVIESLDCASLLGASNACTAGPLVPPFDWTSACLLTPPDCVVDGCAGSTLNGCERGAVFSIDCDQQGLGACAMVTTADGSEHRAACAQR